MVKEIQRDDIPAEMQEYFPEAYKCELCGCIFNDRGLAEKCENKDIADSANCT